MIPKIIHNIWFDELPENIMNNHYNTKKQNPNWEFIIWDENMIIDLLKKYPKIYNIYNHLDKFPGIISKNETKSHIARYIIMKEYGGLYHDINFICNSSFDKLLDEFDKNIDKNTIFIAKFEKTYLDYIFPFSKPKYSSCFMAIEKEHPVWDKVIKIILKSHNKYQITSALDISLQNNYEYNIIILDKVTGNYQNQNQNQNKDTICYTLSETSENTITEYMKFIILYYKQILLFILVFVIIFIIDRINHHNYKLFGMVQMIPGTNIPQQMNTTQQMNKNKNKKK